MSLPFNAIEFERLNYIAYAAGSDILGNVLIKRYNELVDHAVTTIEGQVYLKTLISQNESLYL